MSNVAVKYRYTPEEYLALERKAYYKSEYVNGQIYAMSGARRKHNLIAGNIFGGLWLQFKNLQCEVYMNDMRVKVSPTGMYTYPDVVAVCGDIRLEDAHNDTLLNPTVIVEVLSDSTEAYDRGEKFVHYRRLESLQEYLLVAQDQVLVEHYVRQGKLWVLTEESNPDGIVHLVSIDCTLSLKEVYDKVEFSDSDNVIKAEL
ncbi:MAG TPA: Uma2 family endonuclease [Thermodesulfovibrionia bacterium]|nr:Uma2 family endonuclease [Thermodesulfovibrionia bacterium]